MTIVTAILDIPPGMHMLAQGTLPHLLNVGHIPECTWFMNYRTLKEKKHIAENDICHAYTYFVTDTVLFSTAC